MRNLILITTAYPFGKVGEAFLETEIIYLAERFDKVYIIATKPDLSFKRPVPFNTVAIDFPAHNLIVKSLIIIFRYAGSIAKYAYAEIPFLINSPKKYMFKNIKKLFEHLIKAFMIREYIPKRIDLAIHDFIIYSYWFNSAAFAAGLLKKANARINTVSRLHNWDLYSESADTRYFPFQKTKALLLDKCYFISEQGKRYFESRFVKLPSFAVSRLGIRRQGVAPSKQDDGIFRLVSCSFLHMGKRVQCIIEGLALINEINIHWTHIGGGELYEKLIGLAMEKLSNKKNVSYNFMGYLSNHEVMTFYENNFVHLLINVSENEGLPVSIMEAMSFGVPVIATDVGGTSEIVNESCGILLEKDCNYGDIKSGILKMYSSYQVYPYRKNAFENWERNYNADVNYAEFANQLISLF